VAVQTVADEAFDALATQRAAHALRLAAALDQTEALHAAKRAQVRQRGLVDLNNVSVGCSGCVGLHRRFLRACSVARFLRVL
jgi:hypothetical protein